MAEMQLAAATTKEEKHTARAAVRRAKEKIKAQAKRSTELRREASVGRDSAALLALLELHVDAKMLAVRCRLNEGRGRQGEQPWHRVGEKTKRQRLCRKRERQPWNKVAEEEERQQCVEKERDSHGIRYERKKRDSNV